jgi:hypothetical protein
LEGYNKDAVADILRRGKVRMDNGIGLTEPLPAGLVARTMPHLDSQEAASLHRPLSAKEQEVWEAFGRKAIDLKNQGVIGLDADTVQVTARQALQGGQPYGVTAVDIRPGEAPTERGAPDVTPEPPPPPRIEAPPTEGAPEDVRGKQPEPKEPVSKEPPAVEPPRDEGKAGQPVSTDAGAGVTTTTPTPGVTAGGGAGGGAGAATTVGPAGAGGITTPVPTPGATAPATEEPKVEFPPATQEPGGRPPIEPGGVPAVETVDKDAHGAATSPTNAKPQPTQDQLDAGNYEKGHTEIGPEGAKMPVSIENPVGSQRSNLDVNAARDLSAQIKEETTKAGGVGAGAGPSLELAISSAEKGDFQWPRHSSVQPANGCRSTVSQSWLTKSRS